jgi:hypothetical protein
LPKNRDKLKKVQQELRKQVDISEKEGYDEYGLVDMETLQKYLNVKKLKKIGSGYTTIVFNDPIKKGNILGFTLDETKIKWMQANKKLFDFQLIDKFQYSTGNIMYIYTAKKLNKTLSNGKMSKKNQEIIYNDVINKFFYLKNAQGFHGIKTKDLDYIMYGVQDKELKDILQKLKDTFGPNETLDLHKDQWGETGDGKIILFDPIISERTLNNVEDLNKLDIKTEFKFMLEKIFQETNSAYLKKIRKYLAKA